MALKVDISKRERKLLSDKRYREDPKNKEKIKKAKDKWAKENRDKVKIIRTDYLKRNRLKNKLIQKNYRMNNRSNRVIYQKKYAKRNKEKTKAQILAKKMHLKDKCELCGSKDNLQRHHWRYDKPLLVNTLCATCHSIQHMRNFKNSSFGGEQNRRK